MKITKTVRYHVFATRDEWIEVAARIPRGHKLRTRITSGTSTSSPYNTIDVSPADIEVLWVAAQEAGVETDERESDDGQEGEEETGEAGRGGGYASGMLSVQPMR